MRRKYSIVMTKCRRCGKPLATGNRSLYGADQLKKRLGSICEGCITDEERHEILDGQRKAIHTNLRANN